MRSLFLFTCCLLIESLQSQNLLTVTSATQPPYDANTLIDNFFTSAGIQILNVEFQGDPGSVGFFSGGNDAVNLERGLVLTTGKAASGGAQLGAEEQGINFANTNNSSAALLPELATLATAPLYDVMYYRITFKPTGDSIRFRYVFASEEYPEFACTAYNDIFAFFLDGPRPDGSNPYLHYNIALIPGTNLPVAINNIHPANPTYSCPPLNNLYYIDNNQSLEQPVYDGFTTPFIAEAAVIPCETYVMTLAIADVSDGVYDSGVFLEGNSFGGAIDVGASFGLSENVIPENAQGDTIAITLTNIPASVLPITISLGGEAQNGIDYQTVDTTYTITTSDTIVYLLFQPIADTLSENLETLLINVSGAGCLAQQFSLVISDPDSSMLQGEEIYALVNGTALLAASPTAVSASEYTFSNETDMPIMPAFFVIESPVQVDLPIDNLNDIHTIQSVCINIEHSWADDLDIYLIAPDGRFVELSTDNGGNGDNYTGTCFSPDATVPINFPGPFAPASAAPFTGVFQPEGVWNDILNSPVNGAWKLALMDDNTNFSGNLLNWSISFSGEQFGRFRYLWSTGDTTTAITVTEPGIYFVTISNAVSHQTRKFVVNDGSTATQVPGEQTLLISPNPARDQVSLTWGNELIVNRIRLLDRFGKLLTERKVGAFSREEKLNVKDLPTEMYIIALETADGRIVRKLVKG
ncbi:MAG: choice-of-anchor L domain-containing protein [Saprospiraceae bacterium]|nr:choice-of-anchor L domain-containing protein [Saprospiraceae bacterium]